MERLRGLVQNVAQRTRGAVGVLGFDIESEQSLALMFKHWVETAPNRTFLIFENQRWTYREFDRRVAIRAASMTHLGIKRGDCVALMMTNRPQYLVNVIALSRIGAVPALINDSSFGAGLRHSVMATYPKASIVGSERLSAYLSALAHHPSSEAPPVYVDHEDGRLPPTEANRNEVAEDLYTIDEQCADVPAPATALVKGSDLAAYIYTSGTTGLPKAGKVLNARVGLVGYGFGMVAMGMGPRDVFYCCLPLFHSNGFLVATSSALKTGAVLALARKFSVSRFWTDIKTTNATTFCYIGEVCRYLLNQEPHPDERNHALRCIVGNGMRPEVWSAFVERFRPGLVHEFYGATEGNVNMINFTGKVGSVGRMPPIPKMNNALLVRFDHEAQQPLRDADGRCIPCAADEPGELLGRINEALVSQRFDGYVGQEATNSKILRGVQKPDDAYFRSGDLLKRDAYGWYYFVDRIGDTFRWKGENVSTNEVGDAVQRHDAVEIANTYGVTVAGADGRAGMVTMVLRQNATFDPRSFYEHVESELPHYARPAFIRLADTASVTATFKLQKVQLAKDGYDPEKVSDALFYRDDEQRSYLQLDTAALDRIHSGRVRL